MPVALLASPYRPLALPALCQHVSTIFANALRSESRNCCQVRQQSACQTAKDPNSVIYLGVLQHFTYSLPVLLVPPSLFACPNTNISLGRLLNKLLHKHS